MHIRLTFAQFKRDTAFQTFSFLPCFVNSLSIRLFQLSLLRSHTVWLMAFVTCEEFAYILIKIDLRSGYEIIFLDIFLFWTLLD